MDASRKNFTRLVQWPLLHYYNTTTDAAAGGDGARSLRKIPERWQFGFFDS